MDGYKRDQDLTMITNEVAKHVFPYLDGRDLARAREVCKRWNEYASEEHLWNKLCTRSWRSLQTDPALWRVLDMQNALDDATCWRKLYPKIEKMPKWTCRLLKGGRFMCNVVAHQISGIPIGEAGLPNVFDVERRFSNVHLHAFVRDNASVLYLEPESEEDRHGFEMFTEYLHERSRAGLALEEHRKFIFAPPCHYTRTKIKYHGPNLLGFVQDAFPP